ncbi:MAG: site-2 protease family protein [Bacilli bacterium]|nr:site-2 protease family protein [Bacilli bacterium]
MAWWEWLVGILLFIVALGVLIGIHELGHLGAAKLFNVYCFNYSIGFGPQIWHSKRSAKHETVWSLRAIPLGGFVAMYGEGMADDTVGYIPPNRSLEGVARYKRAIIVSAGVTLNFILGFILIFIHNAAFPHIFFDMSHQVDNWTSSIVTTVDKSYIQIQDGDALALVQEPLQTVAVEGGQTTCFVLDDAVSFGGNNYVLVMKNAVTTTKVDPDLTTSLGLYVAQPVNTVIDKYCKEKVDNNALLTVLAINNGKLNDEEWLNKEKARISKLSDNQKKEEYRAALGVYYAGGKINNTVDPDSPYLLNKDSKKEIKAKLQFKSLQDEKLELIPVEITLKLNKDQNGWDPIGIALKRTIVRYNAGQSFSATWDEWCQSNSTIFVALGKIFTGDISSLGGPLAIASMSSRVLANFGFERYLYMWGMISCNLAIINLLPFPGLDGWTLVVIAYEGVTKKQIPTKVKGILSLVGLLFLMLLAVVILFKDIFGLIV